MYYTESFENKYNDAIMLVNNMVEKLDVQTSSGNSGADIMVNLPCGHNVFVAVILDNKPWVDLHVPTKVFAQTRQPDLIWFCQVDNNEIVNVQSLKTTAFYALAVEPFKGKRRVQSSDFKVNFVEGVNPLSSNYLLEHSGFDERRKCYVLKSDALLTDKTGFSYHVFNPAQDTTESIFWLYVHVMSAMQPTKFSRYSKLQDSYQRFLAG